MGRKPPGRARRKGVRQARSKGKRPSSPAQSNIWTRTWPLSKFTADERKLLERFAKKVIGPNDIPVATTAAVASESERAKPILETIRSQIAALAPLAPMKRKRTILLMEGTNALTGRPVRIYIRPDDTLVACETLGQLERRGSTVRNAAPRS